MCCLVHCGAGHYRGLAILTAYLMDRFGWRLRKTVEFLQSKAVPITLSQSHIEELVNLERYLGNHTPLSSGWSGPYLSEEEELLSKTFINTSNPNNQLPPRRKQAQQSAPSQPSPPPRRVQWQDRLDKQQKKERKRLTA